MATTPDDLRQKLRDYAREEFAVFDFEGGSRNLEYKPRGEIAGRVFVALQNVLAFLENSEDYGDEVDPDDLRLTIGKAFD